MSSEATRSPLSPRIVKARQLFHEYVMQQRDEGHRKGFHSKAGADNRVFGENRLVEQVLRQSELDSVRRPGLRQVVSAVNEVFGTTDEELRELGQEIRISEVRALLAWAVLEMSEVTLSDLGQWLGKDVTTLSSAAQRLKMKEAKQSNVIEKMDQLRSELAKFATLQG